MTNTSNDSLLRLVSQLNANQFEALDDFEPSNELETQIVALGAKFRRQHAIIKTRETLNRVLASHTGQSVEKVAKDTDRDFYMNAEEAKAYGVVDDILSKPPAEEADDD